MAEYGISADVQLPTVYKTEAQAQKAKEKLEAILTEALKRKYRNAEVDVRISGWK